MGTTIADKLIELNNIKKSIREAIKAKGVDVPTSTKFGDYAGKIATISGAGGGTGETWAARYLGEYTSIQSYVAGDVVKQNNVCYVAKATVPPIILLSKYPLKESDIAGSVRDSCSPRYLVDGVLDNSTWSISTSSSNHHIRLALSIAISQVKLNVDPSTISDVEILVGSTSVITEAKKISSSMTKDDKWVIVDFSPTKGTPFIFIKPIVSARATFGEFEVYGGDPIPVDISKQPAYWECLNIMPSGNCMYYGEFSNNKAYGVGDIVQQNNRLYRAIVPVKAISATGALLPDKPVSSVGPQYYEDITRLFDGNKNDWVANLSNTCELNFTYLKAIRFTKFILYPNIQYGNTYPITSMTAAKIFIDDIEVQTKVEIPASWNLPSVLTLSAPTLGKNVRIKSLGVGDGSTDTGSTGRIGLSEVEAYGVVNVNIANMPKVWERMPIGNCTYCGEYSNILSYYKGDVVKQNNILYQAKSDVAATSDTIPLSNLTSIWETTPGIPPAINANVLLDTSNKSAGMPNTILTAKVSDMDTVKVNMAITSNLPIASIDSNIINITNSNSAVSISTPESIVSFTAIVEPK